MINHPCDVCQEEFEINGNSKNIRYYCDEENSFTKVDQSGNCLDHDIECREIVIGSLKKNSICKHCHKTLVSTEVISSPKDKENNGNISSSSNNASFEFSNDEDQSNEIAKCQNCGNQARPIEIPKTPYYRCDECNTFCSIEKRNGKILCQTHSIEVNVSYRKTKQQWYCNQCQSFVKVLRTSKRDEQAKQHFQEALPKLRKVVMWKREVKYFVDKGNKDEFFRRLLRHLATYEEDEIFKKIKEYLLAKDVMQQIVTTTKCDDYAEKSFLSKIIFWALSYFINNTNKPNLTIKGISNESNKPIANNFTDDVIISENALGKRLENENLVKGLEHTLQFTSEMVGSRAFDQTTNDDVVLGYIPIYYDWVYFVQRGPKWELCKKVNKDEHGIKVGIARDWETEAVVGLVAHFTEHPGDREAFQSYLMYSGRKHIIHVSDSGPLAIGLLIEIDEKDQFFILPRRKDTTTILEQNEFKGEKKMVFGDNHQITVLEVNQVTLKNRKQEIKHCKEIRIRTNGRDGKFKYVRLVSNLNLNYENILKIGYKRWRATETEHRRFKQEFGLHKVYLQKPEKFWPLLLLVLISIQLLKLCYRGLHLAHGGKLQPKTFREGFCKFLNAVMREDPKAWKHLPKCDAAMCPYGRSKRQRIS